ncbi:hypothetical protein [Caulobacter sp. S45]|uniref:hypothetical protein n=1 Tax=Caulobacter sp. S45 TaxID=1641861 RepID=UPI001C2D82AD|nr:hypothetical protein [Caulobacter sp. S45]
MSYLGLGSEYVQANDSCPGCITADGGRSLDVAPLLQLSRARKTDLISVSGPSGLELLSALFRSGFEQVVCVPCEFPAAYEQVDAILMAGHRDLETMTRVLRRLAPHLKEGGVLACQLPAFEDDRQVELCLNALGLSVESTVFDLRSAVLVRHTVGHQACMLRAA